MDVGLVIGLIVIAYFFFYQKIMCFFTWKNTTGTPVDFNKGGCGCWSGASGYHNKNKKDEALCCPTKDWQNDWLQGYCTNLPNTTPCTRSYQCTSGYCENEGSAAALCQPKKASGSLVHWNDGSHCASGTSAWWNKQNPPNNEGQCCPTDKKFNAFSQGWCSELVLGSPCTFNEQCASGRCSVRDSPDGICVNTDFGKGCSEHNQCKSEWCHAGKCK